MNIHERAIMLPTEFRSKRALKRRPSFLGSLLFFHILCILIFCGNIETIAESNLSAPPSNLKSVDFFEENDFGWRFHKEGVAQGNMSVNDESKTLTVTNSNGGLVRAFSKNIQLNQEVPQDIKILYSGKRSSSSANNCCFVSIYMTFADGKRVNWAQGLSIEENNTTKTVQKVSVYKPSSPVKTVCIWVNNMGGEGDFTVSDIRVSTLIPVHSSSIGRKEDICLENDFIKIGFSYSNEQTSISSIIDKKSAVNFIRDNTQNIWKINLYTNKGKNITLDRGGTPTLKKENSVYGQKLLMLWSGISIPGEKLTASINVTMTLDNGSSMAKTEISIDCPKGYNIISAAFPVIDGLGPIGQKCEDDFLAIPFGTGYLFNAPTKGFRLDGIPLLYGSNASMQFIAYYDLDAGLYLASYDGQMHTKQMNVYKNVRGALHYEVSHDPEGDFRNRSKWILPYSFIIGTYHGDWLDAAKIYRGWALNQTWCNKGTLYSRKDFSKYIDEIGLWTIKQPDFSFKYQNTLSSQQKLALMSEEQAVDFAGPLDVVSTANAFSDLQKAMGGAAIGFWTTNGWHVDGGLGLEIYGPRFWPRKGFSETVTALRMNKTYTMPYVNIQRWFLELPTYNPENMIVDIDGKPTVISFRSYNTGIMCTGASKVDECWIEKATQLQSEGCAGVYLDELATNGAPVCYSSAHNHLPGDGTANLRTKHDLVEKMKQQQKDPNFFTSGEQGCEAYIDVNDLNFWWAPSWGEEGIPLYEAVYHDYSVGVGRNCGKWESMYGADPMSRDGNSGFIELTYLLGDCFVTGKQLGWIRSDIVTFSPEAVRFIKKLLNTYTSVKGYLLYGELLRFPRLTDDLPTVWVGQRALKYAKVKTPTILSSSWKSYDGKIGFAMVNISSNPQKISYSADLIKEFNLPAFKYYKLIAHNENEPRVIAFAEAVLNRTEIIPGYSPLFIEIIPTNDEPTMEEKKSINAYETEQHGLAGEIPNFTLECKSASGITKAGDNEKITAVLSNQGKSEFSGNLIINIPEKWQANPKSIKISNLQPGHSKEIFFNVTSPVQQAPGIVKVSISAPLLRLTSTVLTLNVTSPRKMLAIEKVLHPPATDGTLIGWDNAGIITFDAPEQIHLYEKPSGFSAQSRLLCDSLFLYLQVRVKDKKHFQPYVGADMWQGDCVQVAFNGANDTVSYNNSYALALTAKGPIVYSFSEKRECPEIKLSINDYSNEKVYTAIFPNKLVYPKAFACGDKIGFNMTCNANDGKNFAGWIEWTKGLCGKADPGEFGFLEVK